MKLKRIGFLVLVISLLLGLLPNHILADTTYGRIYGADRIETALKVCDDGWTSAHTVILAPSDQANLVDALAAAPLAGQKNAPILLTPKNKLDQRVYNKIVNLGATNVYIVGAISDDIYEQFKITNILTYQLKGKDRLETAKKINAQLLNPAGSIVVGYTSLADALSASSYAAAYRYAIILADSKGKIPAGQTLYGASTIIVGNTNQVADITGALRISGNNQYERNARLLEKLPYKYDRIYVANGYDNHLVDSLVISPLAARFNAPILLTNNSAIEGAGIVNASIQSTSQVIALGGPSVVADTVRNKISYVAPDLRVESITPINLNSLRIRFTEKVDKTSAEDRKNYIFNGSDLSTGKYAGSTPILQEDEQTVLIMFYGKADDGESIQVGVKANSVYNKSRNQTALYYTNTVAMNDNAIPTVKSVKVTGDRQLTVEFSETVRIPVLENCEKWILDFGDLKARGLTSVDSPYGLYGYDYIVHLNFDNSIKDGLGKGIHKLKVKSGDSGGQLSDASLNTVREVEFEFRID